MFSHFESDPSPADTNPSNGTSWYLIHTKPRQELIALENLSRQDYECYMPTLAVEKLVKNQIKVVQSPLFPRYIFINLSQDIQSKSWAPIRSTIGVTRMVSFGGHPAKVDGQIINDLRAEEARLKQSPEHLYESGDQVLITQGAFAGIEAVFKMKDGDKRVMVLIEMMSKPVSLPLQVSSIRLIDRNR